MAATREKLPATRQSVTRRFEIRCLREGQPDILKLYATAGMYPDGRLGELFLRSDKADSFLNGALNTVAILFSMLLQHGVALEVVLAKMRHERFEPAGFTGDPEFPSCSSPFDLVAQWLEAKYVPKTS